MYPITRVRSTLPMLAISLALTACGGGGSSNGGGQTASSSTVPVSSASSTSLVSSSSEALSSSIASSTSSSSSAASLVECAYMGVAPILDNTKVVTRLEAENFDDCDESTADTDGQQGDAATRETDVDLSRAAEASGEVYVSHMAAAEYLEYTIEVTCGGLYELNLGARAVDGTAPQLQIHIDGELAGSASVSGQAWAPVAVNNVYLKGGVQRLRVAVTSPGAELDYIEFSSQENDTLTPTDIVAAMGVGLNLGNTLDEPVDERWGAQYEEEYYFDDIKSAGFGHVRIPVTWGGRTDEAAPYDVNAEFMARVEKTVDWALERDFIVIVNVHHERWIKESYTEQDMQRLEAIWTQIADRFEYKPKRLVFELFNEPHGMTMEQVNAANVRILNVIREKHPTRAAVFSGNGYTPYDSLLEAAIPEDDYLIGNYHSYDPWPFGGQCARNWGSEQDKAELRAIYKQVADWSAENNIPATVNEFGAALYDFTARENVCGAQDRLDYFKAHVDFQKEFGIAGTAWDDDGSFRIYDRAQRTWDPVLQSLIF